MNSNKILIVDDDVDILEILKTTLLQYCPSCEIVMASDAQIAFQHLKQTAFKVIITDYQMPKETGADLIVKIKAEENLNKDTPILVLTGYLEEAKLKIPTSEKIIIIDKLNMEEKVVVSCNQLLS